MTTSPEPAEGRILYADVLRVLATAAVITLHTAAMNFYIFDVTSPEWHADNLYDGLVRWCVPLFFMLSGMFFLDPNRPLPLKKLYGRNLLRLASAYVLWSAVYALVAYKTISPAMLKETVKGPIHFWFLLTLAGLYLVTPPLRALVAGAGKKGLQYYLLVCFFFASALPALLSIPALSAAGRLTGQMDVHVALGYAGYFAAGYYLKAYPLSPKARRVLYLLGGLGALATVGLTAFFSMREGSATARFYSYHYPNVALSAAALFVLVKTRLEKKPPGERTARFVRLASRLSFGVFLMHMLCLQVLRRIGLTNETFTPFLSIPVIVALTFGACLLVSWGLSKIPLLSKYCM